MACLPVLEYPDPQLRLTSKDVSRFDGTTQGLVDDLIETLEASGGIGLSAPQVGHSLRIVALNFSTTAFEPVVLINPVIAEKTRTGIVQESCLSLPGVTGNVMRATAARVRAQDRHGSPVERTLNGMDAVSVLHEIDHLNGKLFIDHLSFLGRFKARRPLARLSAASVDCSGR